MNEADVLDGLRRRHLRWGWWSLLVFGALGLVLESLHGFKVGWYLDLGQVTRRHMLTLAHVHGTLLALVNVAWALSVSRAEGQGERMKAASSALFAASLLMPAGFLIGGLKIHGGDPGLGVVLVPVGAAAFLTAVFLTARSIR